MLVDELDLPGPVKERLKALGYSELWPPQEMAVKAGLLRGESMLITTPTASGKTLIALMASSVHVLLGRRKAIYTTPLRALAYEKYEEFKGLFSGIYREGGGVRVCLSTGDYDVSPSSLSGCDVIITTNERLDSIFRHRPRWLERVGIFVFDEIHLLDEEERGPRLEFVVTAARRFYGGAQVLGLSATVNNAEEIAGWLGVKLVNVSWRPVRLREGVAYDDLIVYRDGSIEGIERVDGLLRDLVHRELSEGGQVIVFAETRKRAVEISKQLADVARPFAGQVPEEAAQDPDEEATSLSRTLRQLLRSGVAFHHAGLPAEDRRLVERLFRENAIKVICSTPTLAAGVNLPARTVIISSVYRYNPAGYREGIKVMEYKQMAGRAGRPRYDEVGKSLIMATGEDSARELLERYILGEPEPVTSKLGGADLSALVLALLSIRRGLSPDGIREFLRATLYSRQMGDLGHRVQGSCDFLVKNGFVRVHRSGTCEPTELGTIVSRLYISPVTALGFIRAADRVMAERDMTVPLIMLASCSPDIDPKLPANRTEEGMFERVMQENPRLYELYDEDCYVRSFLGLLYWVNERGEQEMLEELRIEPGDLYRLVDSAEWIVHSYSQLARALGHPIESFRVPLIRVKKGVRRELVEIASLQDVGRRRARHLYDAGFRDLRSIASAAPESLKEVRGIGEAMARKLIKEARERLAGG